MKTLIIIFIFISLPIILFGQPPICEVERITTTVVDPEGPIETPIVPLADPDSYATDSSAPPIRLVYFIHGLGGNAGSWADASTWTDANYQIESETGTYGDTQNAGIDQAANYVKNNMLKNAAETNAAGYDPEEAFIVAHSIGGVLSRRVWEQYDDLSYLPEDRSFGGLVTFGSPHLGHPAANNVDDIKGFVSEACEALLVAPTTEGILQQAGILSLVIPGEKIIEVLNKLYDIVGTGVDELLLSEFHGQTVEQLKPSGSHINSLNNQPEDNLHKVAFYGEENKEDLFWRMFYIFNNEPNLNDTFGANSDGDIMDKAAENESWYYTKYVTWDAIASLSFYELVQIVGLANAAAFRKHAEDLRDEYEDGWKWWRDVDQEYKLLLGIDELVNNVIDFKCYCVNDHTGLETLMSTISTESQCASTCGSIPGFSYRVEEVVSVETLHHPSDGFVRASSAMGFPDAVVGKVMIGNNHLQMRNSSETEKRLKELIDKTYTDEDYGDFFKTNKN